MRVRQRLALYFLSLLTLVSLATEAIASCSGNNLGLPCVEYWRAHAVFIGVANRVDTVPNESPLAIGSYSSTTAHFTVEEPFKGVGGTAIVFEANQCGYLFKEGERYLVYAHRNLTTNKLEVLLGNTRTQPLSQAIEDLKYIRGLASGEPGSRVFGRVTQSTYNINNKDVDVGSLKNAKIMLEGGNHHVEVVTDSEGRYEFEGLPAGTYRIRADLPAYLDYQEQSIKVAGHGCVPHDILAWRKAQIAGTVFDSTGESLIRVPVSLVPADASPEAIFAEDKDREVWPLSVTTLQGRFSFSRLPPGRYLLILNRTDNERSQGRQREPAIPLLFYPGVMSLGAATVIVIGTDDEPREYDFRLPFP